MTTLRVMTCVSCNFSAPPAQFDWSDASYVDSEGSVRREHIPVCPSCHGVHIKTALADSLEITQEKL